MGLASSSLKQLTLQRLWNMWTALANECPDMSDETLSREIARIEGIQSAFDGVR